MEKELKDKLMAQDKWLRGVLMLLFWVIKYVVGWLIVFAAIFQFIFDLISGKPNEKVMEFTKHLNNYLLQVVNFLTYNTETKPFPFADFPGHEHKPPQQLLPPTNK
jgi:hypothetical protein